MNVESTRHRLVRLLDVLHVNSKMRKPEFYEAIQSTTAQISKLRRGAQKMNEEFVNGLIEYDSTINLNWLFKGEGEMFDSGIEEGESEYMRKSDFGKMLKATLREMELIRDSRDKLLDEGE